MKYFIPIFFSVTLFFVACTIQSPDRLADYPSITEIFTEQEVLDLQTLLDSFEQEIGIQADASPETRVARYSAFNTQVLASMEEGNLNNYPLSNEQKIKLLDMLHVGTFRSIWSLGSGVRLIEDLKNRPVITFDIHTIGKFTVLLAELEKEYPQFSGLTDELQRSGGLTPHFVVTLFLQNDKLNMRDARIRLIYVISCLQGEWRN
jgi:hypothetical protein